MDPVERWFTAKHEEISAFKKLEMRYRELAINECDPAAFEEAERNYMGTEAFAKFSRELIGVKTRFLLTDLE